mmetsp:Transcript_19332/g.68352  ORF Transcript_19332/g.68352 Transcript_19332/m.68352 type:complete len:271 (-) Transcript_19332:2916-3728(-)
MSNDPSSESVSEPKPANIPAPPSAIASASAMSSSSSSKSTDDAISAAMLAPGECAVSSARTATFSLRRLRMYDSIDSTAVSGSILTLKSSMPEIAARLRTLGPLPDNDAASSRTNRRRKGVANNANAPACGFDARDTAGCGTYGAGPGCNDAGALRKCVAIASWTIRSSRLSAPLSETVFTNSDIAASGPTLFLLSAAEFRNAASRETSPLAINSCDVTLSSRDSTSFRRSRAAAGTLSSFARSVEIDESSATTGDAALSAAAVTTSMLP